MSSICIGANTMVQSCHQYATSKNDDKEISFCYETQRCSVLILWDNYGLSLPIPKPPCVWAVS